MKWPAQGWREPAKNEDIMKYHKGEEGDERPRHVPRAYTRASKESWMEMLRACQRVSCCDLTNPGRSA